MKFAVIIVAFVILAGTFHIMFTLFDYFYYDNETGVIPRMADILNNSLDTPTQNNAWNNTLMLRQAFGIGRFLWFGMAIFCTVVAVLMKRSGTEE